MCTKYNTIHTHDILVSVVVSYIFYFSLSCSLFCAVSLHSSFCGGICMDHGCFRANKKKLLLHSPCILLNERKIKHSQAGVHLFSVRAQCYIFRWASGMVDAAERRGKEEWQNLPNRHIPLSMQYYSKMYVQSLRSLIFAAHTTPARFPIRFSICTGVCISITQS